MEDLRVKRILERVRQDCAGIFGKNLVGVYVHGSIAFGCFCWESSDIDFLVVTKEAPGQEEKEALIRALLELDAQCPQKGLEMSLVLERYCRDFVYPTPFELHFSNAHKEKLQTAQKASGNGAEGSRVRYGNEGVFWEYCRSMNGTDKDLAAHFTVLRAVGLALCGREISAVFGEVPREAYLDSIWSDIAGAADEIAENPVYVILNLCRVLAFLEEGLVCSKEQGGAWALGALPENFAWRGLIEEAAKCYRTGKKFAAAQIGQPESAGSAELPETAENELKRFAEEMLVRLGRLREDRSSGNERGGPLWQN